MSYSFILKNDSNSNNHSVVLNWLRQSVDANLQVIDNTETFFNFDTINNKKGFDQE